MMAYEIETARPIPYEEYKAIGDLMRAHLQTHAGQLRAMIAFGDLVTRGNTFDIDLLEVVEGWQGQKFVVFSSSPDLPLRGQLRLYLMTPDEFEHQASLNHSSEGRLLDTVREGYDVIYEDPPGYALKTLARAETNPSNSSPLEFLTSGSPVKRA